jgi:hypothetical protein
VNTVIKKKVDRDGGGLGRFHVMTLEEAKALPPNAEFWCITPHDYVFRCKLVGVPQLCETNPDLVTLPCANPYNFSESAILKGHLFVEVASNGDELESQPTLTEVQ